MPQTNPTTSALSDIPRFPPRPSLEDKYEARRWLAIGLGTEDIREQALEDAEFSFDPKQSAVCGIKEADCKKLVSHIDFLLWCAYRGFEWPYMPPDFISISSKFTLDCYCLLIGITIEPFRLVEICRGDRNPTTEPSDIRLESFVNEVLSGANFAMVGIGRLLLAVFAPEEDIEFACRANPARLLLGRMDWDSW